MQLAQQQRLLARLFTDGKARSRFIENPNAFVREEGLSPDEAAMLLRVSQEEVRFFAHSLQHKRCGELEKLLPLSREFLGAKFSKCFLIYTEHAAATGLA